MAKEKGKKRNEKGKKRAKKTKTKKNMNVQAKEAKKAELKWTRDKFRRMRDSLRMRKGM